MIESKKKSINYFEYLRVLCILAVLVIHVSGANWYRIEIGSRNWVIQTFFNICSRFSVCVFCMISGALLLSPTRKTTTRDIYTRYIKRLVICLISWVIIYGVIYTLINHEGFNYFLTRLYKHPSHLWYIFMLIGMYLALPVLRAIAKDRKATLYMIWLIFAFGTLSCIISTSDFFSTIAGESTGFALWSGIIGKINETSVAFVPGYLGFFMLGHYIHEYGLGSWHSRIVSATIPALILSSMLTVWLSSVTDRYVYTLMLESNPLLFLASAGIFAFFRGEKKETDENRPLTKTQKVLLWLGSNTFGVYLVHFAYREILSICFNISVASFNPLLSVPALTLLTYALSLITTVILKKIPGVRKIVS
ncbi:MAG: acyltransferase [Sphaerochaetaceae bacterium]|nr:acyltransferase [Sphaerochaetaceae bacterium]